ncbi:MAG: riboflavin synthase [Fimbriimonadaceae bacterium]
MFTGIVESLGRITDFDGVNLVLETSPSVGHDPIRIGESIALNGCCLTVAATSAETGSLHFNVSPETVSRTTLGAATVGTAVNLERAMRADGRFGGHLVQGHIDATGTVVSITPANGATVIRFRAPEGGERYLVDKGSIAIDGISLTVVTPSGNEFDTWIIPHTLESTNLHERSPGDRVNLEFDAMAKYAERLLRQQ